MTALAAARLVRPTSAASALEDDFPIVEISQLAEQESWRKEINRPLYHIHKWWATRLGSVFRAIVLGALREQGTDIWREFYQTHNLKGCVVLDPFMGSGTTLGEALKLGANAIGCDINPVSTFQVQQGLTSVDRDALRAEFDRLEKVVAPEIRHYYQTIDPVSGESIPVLYYFWIKTLKSPTGENLPLFDRYVFAQDAYPKKKPRAQIICPECWQVLEDRFDTTDLKCTHCARRFNPQAGPVSGQYVTDAIGNKYKIKELLPDGKPPEHRLYAMLALRPNGEKVYLSARPSDLDLFEEAKVRLEREELPLPSLAVRQGHNTDQARGYNYLAWSDFFNSRQLLGLGLLLREILRGSDRAVQEQLICLFSSTLEFNNLFCSYKGEGTGAVRHMFSNHILKPTRNPLENSIWGSDKGSGTFSSLFESRLVRAKQYLLRPFELLLGQDDLLGGRGASSKVVASLPISARCVSTWEELKSGKQSALILNGDSAQLALPDECVDAVITDPPYFDFVHYSELSDFFFAWLAPVLKERYVWFDKADSSDPGEVQQKDPKFFAKQLSKVFAECHRVLKNDGTLAFSFHHSRPEGWVAIYEAIRDAGFKVVAAHPVHAELKAASPKAGAKSPISLDAILVCRKEEFASVPRVRPKAENLTRCLIERLVAGGTKISRNDRFVVGASQLLIDASLAEAPSDVLSSQIKNLQELLTITEEEKL
jgi:putative DNA methylase